MLFVTMAFIGLLRNTLIFVSVLWLMAETVKFYRKLDKPSKIPAKKPCNFNITSPKFTARDNKKFATYSVMMNEKHHMFFIDFPVIFKFYSKENFKSKVKIVYRVPKDPIVEEILNKDMLFTGNVKEHKYFITDIIIGKIDIEIELNISYGNPVIEFEILPNDMCEMLKPCKIEIKFPE
jgi:hypothetical protein